MEESWSQTPNSVWWALETTSSSSITLENMLSPPSPMRDRSNTLSRDQKQAATIFYNYAPDETDLGETEEDIRQWLKKDSTRGAIRVYQAGFSYSEIVKCSLETTAETIMARFFSKELYIQYGNKIFRRVRLDEHPLQLLFRFLQEIGHSNPHRLQVEGMNEDLAPLFKFVAGFEHGKRPEDSVQLACSLKVKEVSSIGVSIWNKRFCVLCGSRMFIFPSSLPKGKPNLVLDLRGGKITEHRSRKHIYCLRITTPSREVLLSFDSRLEQEKWLERAGEVVTKHPLEANLCGHSLEKLPKFYFLNYSLVALNLANNFMIESFEHTDAALLRQPRTIGWIEDLSIFQRLVSLSLSNNCLDVFPPSVCNIRSLKELDLSGNAIKQIPQEVNCLTRLTTLLLHSNQLNTLPYQLHELTGLTTLVIAFNRFFEIPSIVMELSSIAILVASGNYISEIPPEINHIPTLVHLDLRLNRISYPLPPNAEGLRSLLRLNLSGNSISEINTFFVPYLETLNCSGNSLRKLSVNEGPIQILLAKNNKVTQFSVAAGCSNLTTIDISKNELIVLPESLAQLESLEKLIASNNKLTGLPKEMFKMARLTVVRVSNNHLVSLPQDFIDNCPLEQLDLHGNQLSALPDQLFTKAKRLLVINVSSNKLTTLPAPSSEGSRDICSITDFLAANNSLKDSALPTISKFWRLKTLHLAYNDMRIIPPGFFSKLNQMTYLNLAGNSFSSLPAISGCPLLRTLIVHSNQLSSLPSVLVFPHLQSLDLSCNQFETLPDLAGFPRLQQLDLSGNTSLSVNIEKERRLSDIASCCLEGVLDIKGSMKRNTIEAGGTTTHGKWSYGSSQITGIENTINSTFQIKSASLSSRKQDAMFAVLDGGRSPEAAKKLKPILPSIMVAEIREDEKQIREGYQLQDPLQYLAGTFLTAHRRLGETATEYGCSTILTHIHVLKNGTYILNVANTGLGEAILCRSGRAVPLTTTHEPSTNPRERTRIADSRGFISQDGRVNGVCGASRLLGCYHLWPQVIPAPSTESVELRVGDEYVVMGTDGLWKNMTYEQIIHNVQSIADPIRASKRLRDLAVAHGCTTDVSVIIVKLNIDRDPPKHSVLELKNLTPVDDDMSSDEDDDDDNEVTNIDDLISDSDDEEEEESEDDADAGGRMTELAAGYSGNIDQLILDAVRAPPGAESNTSPMVQSTNFDDLPLTDESLDTPSPPVADSAPQDLPGLIQKTKEVMSQLEEMSYVAQTLPKDASKSRKSSKGSTGYGIAETNFETTQSDPALKPLNGVRQGVLPGKEKFNNVNDRLAALNRALARLEEEDGGGPDYSVESIERPRKKSTEIKKRLSYVEHSYNRLTNDTYSSASDSLHGTRNTVHLDNWGQ